MFADSNRKIVGALLLGLLSTIIVHIGLLWTGPLESKWLIIGILSAQNHTRQREVVRSTWGSTAKDLGVDLKFIVGTAFCQVPPDDRVTPYTCEKWWPQISDDNGRVTSNVRNSAEPGVRSGFVGYTFIVKQNFTLHEFHINSCLLSPVNQFVRIKLFNSFTGDVVASATFGFTEEGSNLESRILKKPVSPIKLYSSFEGEIKIFTAAYNFSCLLLFAKPSVMHIFEGLDADGNYVALTSVREDFAVFGGINYRIEEPGYWRNFSRQASFRSQQWLNDIAKLENDLRKERDLHDDFLSVEAVDVYSTLSFKTLAFLKWSLSQGYPFVLKTDDDVFLDVPMVAQELHRSDWDWWSCFKVGWPAPNAGKWRDRISKTRIYPDFPSGSGYVVRADSLKPLLVYGSPATHVGEDVLVGMLVSGANFKPLTISRCHWSCNDQTPALPCNVPEVDPDRIKEIWNSFLNCSKIC